MRKYGTKQDFLQISQDTKKKVEKWDRPRKNGTWGHPVVIFVAQK